MFASPVERQVLPVQPMTTVVSVVRSSLPGRAGHAKEARLRYGRREQHDSEIQAEENEADLGSLTRLTTSVEGKSEKYHVIAHLVNVIGEYHPHYESRVNIPC